MADLLPRFEDYEALAHKTAHRLRMQFSGGLKGVDAGDVFQEVSVAFVLASQKWQPAKGAFSTYFVTAATNRVRAISMKRSRGVPETSLDEGMPDHEERSLHDRLADPEAPLPGDLMEDGQWRDWMLARMRPTTRMVVDLCHNPPPWLTTGAEQVTSRNLYGRERGYIQRANKQAVDLTFVLRILGMSSQKANIVRELERLRKLAPQ
jgi:DNA-directed RNA polymerase specialized sigma24 family protein